VTALVIPFCFDGDADRAAALSYVRKWYERLHDFELVIGTCAKDEPWSKGLAVARAVRRTRQRVLVLADADVLVSPESLTECVRAVAFGDAAWSQPHATVYRLSRLSTNMVYNGELTEIRHLFRRALDRPEHPAPAGGGISVMHRDAFEAVGGIDPRFIGWGGEDISFAWALETLVGQCFRGGVPMWHLYHARAPRRLGNRASESSEQLAARYAMANGDRAAMQELVGERAHATSAHPVCPGFA
jgi:hypothetical protein